jgi:hypothetical protein
VLALLAGIVLQGLAAIAFLDQPGVFGEARAFLNGYYLGALVVAVSAWFSAWIFDRIEAGANPRDHARVYPVVAWLFTAWATAWWVVAGLTEVERALPGRYFASAGIVFFAVTAVSALVASAHLHWKRLNGIGVLLVPAMGLFAAANAVFQDHPLGNYAWAAWPAAFAGHFAFLHRCEAQFPRIRRALHPLGYWILAFLVALETSWLVDRIADGVWPAAAALAVVAALTLATLKLTGRLAWPFVAHARNYIEAACGGVVAVLVVAMVAANVGSPGDSAPLPYVPLLNPLELASLFVFFVAIRWYAAFRGYRDRGSEGESESGPGSGPARVEAVAPAIFALFLLTMAVARTVHHFASVPFDLELLARSDVFQAA